MSNPGLIAYNYLSADADASTKLIFEEVPELKILVVGSGGREHALTWKLTQSPSVSKIYVWPGNAGIDGIAERVPGSVTDIPGIVAFAEKNSIDLTVVGPETPLIAGLSDTLKERGLRVFGPNKAAAQLEGSKVFAKKLMLDNGIPTALCEVFSDPDKADDYVKGLPEPVEAPIVIKADGEAAGKGVLICKTKDEAYAAIDSIMRQRAFGASGDKLVIEEFLDGQETTYMCFVSGQKFAPMTASQDYKRAYGGDQGLNTGGMGAYSPVPVFTKELEELVKKKVVKPTLKALANMGIEYCGVLYVGLALTSKGPKVVEFNCRFGDPETQVVMPLLKSDLAQVLLSVAESRLDESAVNWYHEKALCVVMASGGYPGDYSKGEVIEGIREAEATGAMVFHAGTETRDGRIVTSGGRVLAVTAKGAGYAECIAKAYRGVERIHFEGAHYRRDIGARLL